MNTKQKENVTKMRTAGMTYKEIADASSLSVNTVKSYCLRNDLHPSKSRDRQSMIEPLTYCKQCGTELNQIKGGRAKQFCSSTCRSIWWKNHQDQINRKAYYKCQCACCGKTFTSYGNSHRKYCCHECYIQDHFHSEIVLISEKNCLAIGLSQSVNTDGKGEG